MILLAVLLGAALASLAAGRHPLPFVLVDHVAGKFLRLVDVHRAESALIGRLVAGHSSGAYLDAGLAGRAGDRFGGHHCCDRAVREQRAVLVVVRVPARGCGRIQRCLRERMELRGREALASRRHVLDGVRGVAGLADVEPVREPARLAAGDGHDGDDLRVR